MATNTRKTNFNSLVKDIKFIEDVAKGYHKTERTNYKLISAMKNFLKQNQQVIYYSKITPRAQAVEHDDNAKQDNVEEDLIENPQAGPSGVNPVSASINQFPPPRPFQCK